MTKIIRTASATPGPTRFRLWDMLPEANRAAIAAEMRRRGYLDWNPGDVIEVEPSEEIERIMQQRPVGAQAVIS